MTDRVRPFTLADCDAVKALCDWAWWFKRSPEGWRWLTEGAPGVGYSDETPAGWVRETPTGEVRGFLGNFLQAFDYRGETFAGASLHTLLVHPEVRGSSRDLLRRFADQGAIVRYTFNANTRSAPIYQGFDMQPWPEGLSRVKYVWRTDWPGVISERALRWAHGLTGDSLSRARGERFASDRVWTGVVGRHEPGVDELHLDQIDERFDGLWERLRRDGRMLARRDAATLRWRCGDPDLTRPPILLTFSDDNGLAGYLMAFFSKGSEVERPALEIIDVIAAREVEAAAAPALIRTLLGSARALGAARVRLPFVSPGLEALLGPFRNARRVYDHDHCHVGWNGAVGPDLRADWYATPFDGDYSFCLRPPPVSAARQRAA
ncbi:MAG TPA: N-acetyltransferase [Caulobacter sp.]|nr:N-acetyltransferase [Caulobacter sp.]